MLTHFLNGWKQEVALVLAVRLNAECLDRRVMQHPQRLGYVDARKQHGTCQHKVSSRPPIYERLTTPEASMAMLTCALDCDRCAFMEHFIAA